jgi:hypothetical protein
LACMKLITPKHDRFALLDLLAPVTSDVELT